MTPKYMYAYNTRLHKVHYPTVTRVTAVTAPIEQPTMHPVSHAGDKKFSLSVSLTIIKKIVDKNE